jgi:5-methylthioadenosine/S-adenosylhomocysteine deaminase
MTSTSSIPPNNLHQSPDNPSQAEAHGASQIGPNQPDALLLCPEWLLPIRPARQILKDHALLLKSGRIADLGPRAELSARYPGVAARDLPGQVLMPGLVNLHSHAAMSLMRGFADDLPLHEWLNNRIWPAELKVISPEFVYDGALLACHEMLLGGMTCFNDMYFYPESTARAALDLGMRCCAGIVVFEFPSSYGTGPDDYLAKGLAVRDNMRGEPLVSFTLAPHAPYTVSDDSFRKVVTMSNELDLPVHCHIHETAFEIEQSMKDHGKRPLARLHELGLVGPSLIAVHAVHLNQPEIELLAKSNVTVAHCPHSNLKLASGIAPTAKMLGAGLNLGIGTDGSASNNRLDLWQEGRTAALLAKGLSLDAAVFDAFTLLEAMTLKSAKAIGLGETIGSLEIGKAADLITIELGSRDLHPLYDPIAHLAYSVGRENVKEVWINGVHVVHKRQLTHHRAEEQCSLVTARSLMWQNTLGEIQAKPQIV